MKVREWLQMNVVALLALGVAIGAWVSNSYANRVQLAMLQKDLKFLWSSITQDIGHGLPANTPFAALTPVQQSGVLRYWGELAPTEFLVINRIEPQLYRKQYAPMIVEAARRRYFSEGLCQAIMSGSTLGGTYVSILRQIEDGNVHLVPCDAEVHKILNAGSNDF